MVLIGTFVACGGCATGRSGFSPGLFEGTVALSHYSLRTPPGGPWQVDTVKASQTVMLERRNPGNAGWTDIVIFEAHPQQPERRADQIAEEFENDWLDKVKAISEGSVVVTGVARGVKGVGGKIVHWMAYRVVHDPESAPTAARSSILYLYFPSRQPPHEALYGFQLDEFREAPALPAAPDGSAASPAPLDAILNSFELK